MKYTIHTAFNRLCPCGAHEIGAERILCNDVILPGERHPYNMRLWVIGDEYGAICAVWASNEQDALDEMIDSGLGDSFLVADEDLASMTPKDREDLTHLGNAGELCDLANCWMGEAEFEKERDFELLIKFAEARGACAENLDKV